MIVKSIRQLAPHIGISNTMLNRYLRKKKFAAEPGGGYDVEKVRAALKRNRDLEQPSQGGRGKQSAADDDIGLSAGGQSAYEIFNRARAAKEIAVAKGKQLDLQKRQGELLDIAEMEQVLSNIITATRALLLNIPAKMAPRLAVVSDPFEVQTLLEREIRNALASLSEYDINAVA